MRSNLWWLSLLLAAPFCLGQESLSTALPSAPEAPPPPQIAVNWLYGAYIPRDKPLVALTPIQRTHLFVRQSFTTPGIYVKTGFLAILDQAHNSPPEWGDGFAGFAKRVGTRHTQSLLQNTITSLGDGVVGWEPRYDRCKCDGVWPRSRHAMARNFVTYDRSEKHLRPQLMPYIGAFSSGAITASWQTSNPNYVVKGYQSAITQAVLGSAINLAGEFAPSIIRKLKKHKE